ncbi:50S ribosomal protein L31e [uncultured archaeon]|nr:50S ribosomal protein L31e [uncultured archaeon]
MVMHMADEKIYTVPLGDAYDYIRTKRVRRAVKIVQQFVARHSKVAEKNVRISNALNSVLWARGIQKPPRRIKIKVVKEADAAKAYLVDEQIKKPEPKKDEKKEAEAPKAEANAVAPKAAAKPETPKAEAKKAEKPAEAKKAEAKPAAEAKK